MKTKINPIIATSAIVCTGALAYALIRFRFFYHDDEMITLRYVRNFLDHKGLNWNPGERVEGYSNFLHLIFSSFMIWLTGDFLLGPRIVNMIFFCWLIFSSWYLFKRKFPETAKDKKRLLLMIFLLIVVSYPGMIIWTYGGLETVMYTCLVFMGISAVLYLPRTVKNSIWAGLFFTMAAMTHPDGVLFFALSMVYLLVMSVRHKNWAAFPGFVITFIALFGSYFFCRYTYYGQLLPNTFYTKTNFTSEKLQTGFTYAGRFASSIILVIAALGFLLWRNIVARTVSAKAVLLLLVICIYVSYIISYGGDHMSGFRFMIPVLPLIALLCSELASRLSVRNISIAMILLTGNIFFVYAYNQTEFREATVTDPAAYIGAVVGNYLDTALPNNELIATNSAGAIPFFASRDRFIDMLGLCDTTISHRENMPMLAPWQHVPGHEKGDGNYVLSRKPDIIILGPANGADNKAWFLSDAEMLSNPIFKHEYEKQKVRIPASYLKLNSMVVFRQDTPTDSLTFTYYKRIINN
jgi:hypothetical protein